MLIEIFLAGFTSVPAPQKPPQAPDMLCTSITRIFLLLKACWHTLGSTPHAFGGTLGRAILTGVERAVLSRHRHRHTSAVCILGSSWGHKVKNHWSLNSQDPRSPKVPASSNPKPPAVPKPPWQQGYPATLAFPRLCGGPQHHSASLQSSKQRQCSRHTHTAARQGRVHGQQHRVGALTPGVKASLLCQKQLGWIFATNDNKNHCRLSHTVRTLN